MNSDTGPQKRRSIQVLSGAMGSRWIALHLAMGLRVRVLGAANGVEGKVNAQASTPNTGCKVMALERRMPIMLCGRVLDCVGSR